MELAHPNSADDNAQLIELQQSNEGTRETSVLGAGSILQVDYKETSNSNDTNTINSVNDAQDWAKFKSDFSESLEASEETMGSLGNGGLPLQDFKQQLLLSAIVAMHDDPEAAPAGLEVSTATTEMSKSPSKVRRRLVSLNSLETIHESELDKLLEGDNLLPEAANTVEANLTRPAAPILVWEKEDTGQLLRDLGEKMSKATTATDSVPSVSAHTNDWRNPSTGKHTLVC